MARRALCLLGAVIIGLGATGATETVAAEQAVAPDEERGFGKPGTGDLPVSAAVHMDQGFGKPGAAHLPVTAAVTLDQGYGNLGAPPLPVSVSVDVEQGYGKLGTAHLPVGTPAEVSLKQRLADRGMRIGSPIMIRIFKAEAELEVWMKAGERFELLATYPICNWAGTPGPKLTEGDMQSPEGFYAVGRRQLRSSARWRRSLDIGYPNAFDRVHARTGSSILVHGGCTSTGCFAMTDRVMDEIFLLSRAALWHGQKRIALHIFPFRMTPENMARHADSRWYDFWTNLKEGYDLFERTRLPPTVKVCGRRYVVSEADENGACPPSNVTAVTHPLAAPKGGSSAKAEIATYRPGRNARQAYAQARKARVAAKARYAKPAPPPRHARPARHRHVHAGGYRKLAR